MTSSKSIDDEWKAYLTKQHINTDAIRVVHDSKYTNKTSSNNNKTKNIIADKLAERKQICPEPSAPYKGANSVTSCYLNSSTFERDMKMAGNVLHCELDCSVYTPQNRRMSLERAEATAQQVVGERLNSLVGTLCPLRGDSRRSLNSLASESNEDEQPEIVENANKNCVDIENDSPNLVSRGLLDVGQDYIDIQTSDVLDNNIPKCDELYISTKTKVLFLNQAIDIQNIYWKIPVVEYWKPLSGIVKKQMKIVSKTPDEYADYRAKLEGVYYYTENIIKQIDNPAARRIKFKDERKITIGLSRKDIMNCRGKVKNAFYNCFAIILRFEYDGAFREIHVKVFNTGKLEIPGILNTRLFDIVKGMILQMLQPHIDGPINFVENDKDDNVLINSNFNCGYYINRDKLHQILRSDTYGIEAAYDPCSYPGVKCKFYFNNEIGFDFEKQNGKISRSDRSMKMSELTDNKKYTEVSFMIFRTGSCLIVGNCSEKILRFIFAFIRNMLAVEYANISVGTEEPSAKNKKTKLRKKTISVSQNYYDATIRDKTSNLINVQSNYKPFM